MFVAYGDEVYGGQIVGEHNRDNDLTVGHALKHLDNMQLQDQEKQGSHSGYYEGPARNSGLEAANPVHEDRSRLRRSSTQDDPRGQRSC